MPPKFKFTRNEIIDAALNLVRERGAAALTARGLAERLGSSPKPIFNLFRGMDEVRGCVIDAANSLYNSYIQADMTSGRYPPYKASGMAYIRFARDERELFRLLFMRDRSNERVEENRDEIRPLLEIIEHSLGIDEDAAYLFHLEMWVYVHGIATMIATGYLEWDTDFVSHTLSDMYTGLKYNSEVKASRAAPE